MNRRTFVIGSAALAVANSAPATVIDRAIRYAGGVSVLRRVRELRWQGEATVYAAGRQIGIGVSTRVTPFTSARSDSWLLAEGPGKARSLILEPTGGWLEREGMRAPLPDRMVQHERAQYALYGLMLLVTLGDAGASGLPGGDPNTLIARHSGAPDTTFGVDPDGRLAWATNMVPKPDGEGRLAQLFKFSGDQRSGGVHWPARIEIAQNGAPFFDLRLTLFEART